MFLSVCMVCICSATFVVILCSRARYQLVLPLGLQVVLSRRPPPQVCRWCCMLRRPAAAAFVANSLRRSASACAASGRPREAARARGQRQKRPSPITRDAHRHPMHWTHVRTRGPRDAQPLPPPLDANSNPPLNPHPQQVFIETLREQSGER